MNDPALIAGLLALAVGLTFYLVLVQRPTDRFSIGEDKEEKRNPFMKLVSLTSSEIYSALPANISKRLVSNSSTKAELLIQKSGNPWNLKANEFLIFQVTFATLGLIVGMLLGIFMKKFGPFDLAFYWYGIAVALLGFIYPKTFYSSTAKKRDIDFKRQLPDALDLIIISLSAGVTFQTALREALPNMKPGVLKEELQNISYSLDSGKTLSESLDQFATKSPSESISSFVRAIKEATELNVPLIEIMESRAEASRKEYFALIQQKTASLESKMMGVLTPTLVPALLILVVAPSIASLMQTMGVKL
jgi:tight adherence protein C